MKFYDLIVSYEGGYSSEVDKAIISAVGKKNNSGIRGCGDRTLLFRFDNKPDATKAASRVRKVKSTKNLKVAVEELP